MLLNYLKLALRLMMCNPFFTFISMAGLGLISKVEEKTKEGFAKYWFRSFTDHAFGAVRSNPVEALKL